METKKLYTKEGNEFVELIDYRGLYVTPMDSDGLLFSKEKLPDSIGLVIDQNINKLTLLMFEHGYGTWNQQNDFLENIQNKKLILAEYNPKYYIPKRWEILKNIKEIQHEFRDLLMFDSYISIWTSESDIDGFAWSVCLYSNRTEIIKRCYKCETCTDLTFVEIDV